MNITFYSMEKLRRQLEENQEEFIASCEEESREKPRKLARQLAKHKGQPVVLLCGPSGSGKTTTASRLAGELHALGFPARAISMDHYFLPAINPDVPRDANGEIDFESPYRLDIPLLSKQMEDIFACRPTYVPYYDFPTQSRKPGFLFQRQPDEFVIFEGIHALNPLVTGAALDFSSRIYISVRTRLRFENGECLHPSHIRLMRRLLRDSRYRGRSFLETMDLLPSVTAGEEDHILPFKRFADYELDSFMPYEGAVYAGLLTGENLPQHRLTGKLRRFLEFLPALSQENVPGDSLLREFIGEIEE